MAKYEKADKTMVELVKIGTSDHPDMITHKVKIDVLMAYGKQNDDGEQTSPAIKDRGHQVLGKVKVCSSSDRAKGTGDCEIVIDGDQWLDLDHEQQVALIDRLLSHFEFIENVDGEVQHDDNGRPRMRKRWGDYHIYGFVDVAERHGEHSVERRQLEELNRTHGQLLFSFMSSKAA